MVWDHSNQDRPTGAIVVQSFELIFIQLGHLRIKHSFKAMAGLWLIDNACKAKADYIKRKEQLIIRQSTKLYKSTKL